MAIVRYSPLKSLNMFKELDPFYNFMDDILPEFRSVPAMDVTMDEKGYNIKADVPGFDKKDIIISVDNSMLTIEGKQEQEAKEDTKNYIRKERRFSSFKKSVQLYDDVDAEKIKASLKNGILELSIPKKEETKPPPKKIEVE